MPAPHPGDACRQPGCGGMVLSDGYCDTCGAARDAAPSALATSAWAPPASRSRLLHRTAALAGAPGRAALSPTVGGGLVAVPDVVGRTPEAAAMPTAEVPEHDRFCSYAPCGKPVGRTRGEFAGRLQGHCPHCGHWFSFLPALAPGDLVAGQYQVLGPIGHGGRGWVFVARDRNLADRPVVIKGILDAGDTEAAKEAAAEMRFLAVIEHPQIVQVHNFVVHAGSAFIVMEYVAGTSLERLIEHRDRSAAEPGELVWAQRSLAYLSGVLEAMDYLHAHDIAYNDLKPENIMAVGRDVKLIDLGAARRLGDLTSGVLATPGYHAPELPETGPTVATDLYTVGRTLLGLLSPGIDLRREHADSTPGADVVELFASSESLERLVLRATATDPADRFGSAAEMREQMLGVLHELVAIDTGVPQPRRSLLFGGDGGRGMVSLDWTELPEPLPETHDPAQGLLASLAGTPARETAIELQQALDGGAIPDTLGGRLHLIRAQLAAEMLAEADEQFELLTPDEAADWRTQWMRGIAALAAGDASAATEAFDRVALAFPGEIAPRLALAAASELAGDDGRAAELYDAVSCTDPSFTMAAFGLARRLASSDRAAAADALMLVPPTSHLAQPAAVAAIRARVALGDPSAPPVQVDDVVLAAEAIDRLQLPPDQRAWLLLEIWTAALVVTKRDGDQRDHEILGARLTTDAVRRGMERAYRALARYAESAAERARLVDLANAFRPVTIL